MELVMIVLVVALMVSFALLSTTDRRVQVRVPVRINARQRRDRR